MYTDVILTDMSGTVAVSTPSKTMNNHHRYANSYYLFECLFYNAMEKIFANVPCANDRRVLYNLSCPHYYLLFIGDILQSVTVEWYPFQNTAIYLSRIVFISQLTKCNSNTLQFVITGETIEHFTISMLHLLVLQQPAKAGSYALRPLLWSYKFLISFRETPAFSSVIMLPTANVINIWMVNESL